MVKTFEFSESNADELVVRARTQGEALAALYELVYDRIFRFCVYRVANKAAAEDICSEVFLDVARAIRSFRGSTYAEFRNWVYAIAVNQANSYLRKTRRRARLLDARGVELVPKSVHPDHSLDLLDWPVLHEAILRLKPQHQTLVILRFFEDMDYASIGAIVKMRTGAVRVTLHRLLKKLRSELMAEHGGGAKQ